MAQQTFRELEYAGWTARAARYEDMFAPVTRQAIAPILASFGELRGRRLLDVACGPGHLAGAAAMHGAAAEGIDFVGAMVAQAAASYPPARYMEGDAEQLPYADDQFDYVACAFGLLHLQQPEQAIAEAWRVLRGGGRYTFTVWCTPDQGNQFFELVLGAIQAHATFDVALPPAPPLFRFADPDECCTSLARAGFVAPRTSSTRLTWYGTTPSDILDLIYGALVRTPALLAAQTDAARERVHSAILAGAEQYRVDDRIVLAMPALLATAEKP